MRTETWGRLTVRIAGGTNGDGAGDGPVVVLMHGFGAPGEDLVPLWRVIEAPRGTRFVFPQAPLTLPAAYMGARARAWWAIDMARLEQAMMRGETRDMTKEIPVGLDVAREHVVAMLAEVDTKLSPSKLVIGGFSQGAMLACDVALRTDRALAGLVMLSGTFLAESEWGPRLASRRDLAVFMSHGKQDRLLPFGAAEALRDRMQAAGLAVTWRPFQGEHEIPGGVLTDLGAFLRAVT